MTVIRSRQDLERMQADGEISTGDADEIRTFMDFLQAAPSHADRRTPEGRRQLREAYAEHYPEDYAATVAAHTTEKENRP